MSKKTTCPLSPDGNYCDDDCQWYDLERKDCRIFAHTDYLMREICESITESADIIANAIIYNDKHE